MLMFLGYHESTNHETFVLLIFTVDRIATISLINQNINGSNELILPRLGRKVENDSRGSGGMLPRKFLKVYTL